MKIKYLIRIENSLEVTLTHVQGMEIKRAVLHHKAVTVRLGKTCKTKQFPIKNGLRELQEQDLMGNKKSLQ